MKVFTYFLPVKTSFAKGDRQGESVDRLFGSSANSEVQVLEGRDCCNTSFSDSSRSNEIEASSLSILIIFMLSMGSGSLYKHSERQIFNSVNQEM